MRTFIIRARKGTTQWQHIKQSIGTNAHIEVVAHSVVNAFFTSNAFREDVEVYIVLDSSADFPRTIKLSSNDGLSLAGFYEAAVLEVLEQALKNSQALQKNETLDIAPGIKISGFGFEKLIASLIDTRPVYLLEPKGEHIDSITTEPNPIFILSDHIALPKNTVKGLKRHGVKSLSLGKKMLFASQCIVLIHHTLDS